MEQAEELEENSPDKIKTSSAAVAGVANGEADYTENEAANSDSQQLPPNSSQSKGRKLDTVGEERDSHVANTNEKEKGVGAPQVED